MKIFKKKTEASVSDQIKAILDTPQSKTAKRKRIAKTVAAVAVGVALLAGGSTLASWHDSASIDTAVIQTGELSLDTQALGWTFNGTPVAEGDLDTLRLSPGDSLIYSGTATPTLEGTNLAAELSLSQAATAGSLLDSPVVDISWEIDGSQAPVEVSEATSGAAHTIAWALSLAPAGDPAYVTGQEAQLQTLDLSQVKVELNQVAN